MDEGQQAVSKGRPLSFCSPLRLLFLPTLPVTSRTMDPPRLPPMHPCRPTPLFYRLFEPTCYRGTVDESLGFELALALDEVDYGAPGELALVA